jgi:hypothetical protein
VEMSGAIWLVAATGLTVTVIAALRALWPEHNASRLDVGPVSDHWLAEHRVGSNDGLSSQHVFKRHGWRRPSVVRRGTRLPLSDDYRRADPAKTTTASADSRHHFLRNRMLYRRSSTRFACSHVNRSDEQQHGEAAHMPGPRTS